MELFGGTGMAANEIPCCNNCGMTPAECSCTSFNTTGWHEVGTNLANLTTTNTDTITVPDTYIWPNNTTVTWPTCSEHRVDKDSIVIRDEEIHAACAVCRQQIVLPHVEGGLTFEKGGAIIGRAMTLEDGDDEKIGELLAELNLLEEQITKEEVRYRRARGLIKIARDLVQQRALADNAI